MKRSIFCIIIVIFYWPVIDCRAQSAYDSLTINNIGGRINVPGDNFYDPAKFMSGFEAPIHSGKHTIFASALWIGGFENNNLKLAAMTYRQSGVDFFPGPLDTATGKTNSNTMQAWNNLWNVKQSQIDDFLKNGTSSPVIKNWPGNTWPMYDINASRRMAPFVDVNKNGVYEPDRGDYPDIKGDQMIWWTFNDAGGTHEETKGDPLGIEVKASAYAFNTTIEVLNNTIFMDYKITNRSKDTLKKTMIGIWTDFDIGYPYDDYIGCSPENNAYFGYNGTAYDPDYKNNTPVQSVIFLKDKMTHFLAYNNTANTTDGNPGYPNTSPLDYYNYLSGIWKNGQFMTHDSQRVNYMYDGDIIEPSAGWTEYNSGNKPGDRRGIGAVGPVTIPPGETFDLPFAYVFAQKTGGNTNDNFNLSKQYWDDIRLFYWNYLEGIENSVKPAGNIMVYPNPAHDQVTIRMPGIAVDKILMIDNTGRTVKQVTGTEIIGDPSIDISGIPQGFYTVLIYSSRGIMTQKIVIQK
jgi:hypothetical protein